MPRILFAATEDDWHDYRHCLPRALQEKGIQAELVPVHEGMDPALVDYIVYAPAGPLQDFSPYTKARAVLSLWTGVEKIVGNASLTQPLCRMVDHGLERGMVEWVLGHVMAHHLGIGFFAAHQDGVWRNGHAAPLASDRKVTVLGLGALGRACAKMLAQVGFNVIGWSRSPKEIEGITCLSGDAGLKEALIEAEILVTLLPQTPQTTNLLDAAHLGLLPEGAVILNPGRGTVLVDEALLAALDAGEIGHAVLDVFRVEPLPATHPFWAHPRVTVTPHIAAATRPETASKVIAENIARAEAGQPLLHLVDRTRGY
ncbi:glyoxylate/hydroxypyruvate reductase A [Thioclava sp. GXIMD2076]|uniref:2-hydroxyacid dehydrogenase n=1 Tax=Thioclava sp. GXIMD2076 TaxID=3131931 RepID=UPI0030D261ED